MNWHDVRFIRLVHVEIGASGAEEGGEDEIEFAIGKTIQIGMLEIFFPIQINLIDRVGQG